MLEAWLQLAVLLLTFTLATLVVLTLGVRLLMIARRLPVPAGYPDMLRPRGFRTLMVAASALIAPLAAARYLPVVTLGAGHASLAYLVAEALVALVLWWVLELYHRSRMRRGSG